MLKQPLIQVRYIDILIYWFRWRRVKAAIQVPTGSTSQQWRTTSRPRKYMYWPIRKDSCCTRHLSLCHEKREKVHITSKKKKTNNKQSKSIRKKSNSRRDMATRFSQQYALSLLIVPWSVLWNFNFFNSEIGSTLFFFSFFFLLSKHASCIGSKRDYDLTLSYMCRIKAAINFAKINVASIYIDRVNCRTIV